LIWFQSRQFYLLQLPTQMSASTPFNSVAIQCASLCFVNPDEVELILSSIFLDQLETHLDIISPDSESPRKASTPLHCWFSVSPLMVWILEKHWYLPGKKLQKAVTSVLESHPNTILKSSYMQCRLLSNADCSIPALVVHSSQDLPNPAIPIPPTLHVHKRLHLRPCRGAKFSSTREPR